MDTSLSDQLLFSTKFLSMEVLCQFTIGLCNHLPHVAMTTPSDEGPGR